MNPNFDPTKNFSLIFSDIIFHQVYQVGYVCFPVVRSFQKSLAPIYVLSTIGDLCDSMLLVGAVIYATILGASEVEIGWIGGAYGLAYFFMPAILGRLGDKISRKTSLIIATTSFLLIPFYFLLIAKTPLLLFVGRILVGIFYSFFWTAIEAYISEKTGLTEQSHRTGISNFCIAWGLGYWLGPFAAAWLSDTMIAAIFYFTLAMYSIGWLVVMIFIPNVKPNYYKSDISKNEKDIKDNPKIGVNIQQSDNSQSRMVAFLLISLVFYSCIARLALTYFPFYAVSPNGSLLWSGKSLSQVLFFFGLGRMSFFLLARFWNTQYYQIAIAYIVIGVFMFLLIYLKSVILFAVAFYILGFAIGFIYLTSLNLTLHHEKERKGGRAGLFESAIGMGNILSPVIAGWLGSFSLQFPFIVFAIVPLIISLLYFLFFRKATK
jgi:MFS family permease